MSSVIDLDEIVEQIQQRLAAGVKIDVEEVLRQFPEHADRLRDLMAPQRSGGDSATFNMSGILRHPPTTAIFPPSSHKHVDDIIPLGQFGEYELLEQIARGGMGIVFKAFQFSLNRVVALKSIRHGRSTSEAEIERFRQEAQAAAVLNHPNIVPVYACGEVGGQHYFTMEYVEGPSLAEIIRDSPLPAKTAVEYVRTIAKTVDYAHRHGVVHRDLKPANILITEDGQPRITDFGVAKLVEQGEHASVQTQIFGTPGYMSPEQSLGQEAAGDPSNDIYSLGALLYALLTSRAPFQAESSLETLVQVRNDDPVAPRLLNPQIPRDVETICLKCLRKDSEKRYATAAGLADDLECHLAGKPILARPVGRIEKLARLCHRNPMVASLTAGAIALTMTLVIVQMLANSKLNRVNSQLNKSNRELDRSQVELENALYAVKRSQIHAEELVYVSDIKEAGRAWSNGDARQTIESLERQQPQFGQRDLREVEWDFLWNHARIPSECVTQSEQPLYFVCYSPDGQTITTAGQDAVIRIYDAVTFRERIAIETKQIEVNGLAYSTDGTILSSAGDDGTLCLWRINLVSDTAAGIRRIPAHEFQVYNVAFTPDDRTLVSTGRDPVVRLWDVETGQSIGTFEGHERSAGSIAVSPDGETLATAGHDGRIALWDMGSQSLIRKVHPNIGRLTSVGLSLDGSLLVTSSTESKVQVWSVPALDLIHEFEHLDAVQRSLFTPDGSAVVACDTGGMIRIWPLTDNADVERGTVGIPHLRIWKAHRDRVYAMATSPDGKQMLSVGSDGKLLASTISSDAPGWQLQKKEGDVEAMVFTGGNGLLATIDEHHVELWNPEDGSLVRRLEPSDGTMKSIASCATGATLVVGGEAGMIDVWKFYPEESKTTMRVGEQFSVNELALSPGGAYLAAVERYETDRDCLRVFDMATGKRLESIQSPECNSAAFSQDGQWLFASGESNLVQLWHLPDGERIVGATGHVDSINHLQFSQDDRWVATGSDDRLVKVWEHRTVHEQLTLAGHLDDVKSIAFAPDSRTLASAGEDGRLKFWNIPSGQMLFELNMSPGNPEEVAFSPDRRFLACLVRDPTQSSRQYRVHLLDWERRVGVTQNSLAR